MIRADGRVTVIVDFDTQRHLQGYWFGKTNRDFNYNWNEKAYSVSASSPYLADLAKVFTLARDLKLTGEDREFGEDGVCVALTPKTCWGMDLMGCISQTDWKVVREFCKERAGGLCECCGGTGNTLGTDYSYCYETQTRKLERIRFICKLCCEARQMGRTAKMEFIRDDGSLSNAERHLVRNRNFTPEEYASYYSSKRDEQAERSKIEWRNDFSILDDDGIAIIG